MNKIYSFITCFTVLSAVSALIFLSPPILAANSAPTPKPERIDSKVPPAKEPVVEPLGYLTCKEINGRWVNGEWHSAFKICQYNLEDPKIKVPGAGWVGGHWVCTQYQMIDGVGGQCSAWDWRESKWTPSFEEIDSIKPPNQ